MCCGGIIILACLAPFGFCARLKVHHSQQGSIPAQTVRSLAVFNASSPVSTEETERVPCPYKVNQEVTYISAYGERFDAKVEEVHHPVVDFTQRGYTLSFEGTEKENKRVRCFKVRNRMSPNEPLPGAIPEEEWPQELKEGKSESSLASKFWGRDSFILADSFMVGRNGTTGRYRDTRFRFPCGGESCIKDGKKLVALTLHDGLMNHYDDDGTALGIVNFLLKLLKHHDAKATIFLIGNYFIPHLKTKETDSEEKKLKVEQARRAFERFLDDGHEFGNHNMEDRFYSMDWAETFRNDLMKLQNEIETFTSNFENKLEKNKPIAPQIGASPHEQLEKIKWYSPPKAVMSYTMRDELDKNGFQTVIGSAYAEDWSIQNSEFIAQTLLKQAKTAGSIIILHLPGISVPDKAKPNQVEAYWWWTLHALEKLLIYLKENGFATTTLSDLAERSSVQASDP